MTGASLAPSAATSAALVALPPPPPPNDLIPSASFLPLHAINEQQHRGKKLRLIGQILAYHPATSLLLLTAHPPAPSLPSRPQVYPTILIDISIPLLGQNPATKDLSSSQDTMSLYSSFANSNRQRETLKLDRGAWVCAVGWLEGDGTRLVSKVKTSSTYARPLPLILEAIHVGPSREPPIGTGAMYKGLPPSSPPPPATCITPGTQDDDDTRTTAAPSFNYPDNDSDGLDEVDEAYAYAHDATPRAKKRAKAG